MNDPSDYVREALWGKPQGPFDPTSQMAQLLTALTRIRSSEPALRYGRQYFRQTADQGSTSFAVSAASGGAMAYSRILAATEVLIVCNTNNKTAWTGDVIIDTSLNPDQCKPVAWSSRTGSFKFPAAVSNRPPGTITVDGNVAGGNVRTITVALQPMEAQIIRPTPDPGQTAVLYRSVPLQNSALCCGPMPGITRITGRISRGSSVHPARTGRPSCGLKTRYGGARCSAA